jgi:large subunit ribosomal protein L24
MPQKVKKPKMRLKQGDKVRVISGSHKGSEGKIMAVFNETNRVIVESVNIIKKTQKPTQDNPRGGYIEREAAIHASNVQMLDPQTDKPIRIAYKQEETGKIRVSAKTGTRLDD